MVSHTAKIALSVFFVLCVNSVRGEYSEGIDTTDSGGSGLGFKVTNGNVTGSILIYYVYSEQSSTGYFNYAFDEISMVPDTVYPYANTRFESSMYRYSFMVKTGNSFSKIQLLRQLSDGRYSYRFGTLVPASSNDRILAKDNYDRSVRYNVNNLFSYLPYCGGNPSCNTADTLRWDPPLANTNTLVGYIVYVSKSAEAIDTARPINPAQWDSVAFSTSTKVGCYNFPRRGYFNMVTVYREGKSAFLRGWSLSRDERIGIKRDFTRSGPEIPAISVKNTGAGLLFEVIAEGMTGINAVDIFSLNGRRVGLVSDGAGQHFSSGPLRNGAFLMRVTTPSGSVFVKPVLPVR